jgi:hypothetical protein
MVIMFFPFFLFFAFDQIGMRTVVLSCCGGVVSYLAVGQLSLFLVPVTSHPRRLLQTNFMNPGYDWGRLEIRPRIIPTTTHGELWSLHAHLDSEICRIPMLQRLPIDTLYFSEYRINSSIFKVLPRLQQLFRPFSLNTCSGRSCKRRTQSMVTPCYDGLENYGRLTFVAGIDFYKTQKFS